MSNHTQLATQLATQSGGYICDEHSDESTIRVIIGDICADYDSDGSVTVYDARFDEFHDENHDSLMSQYQ